MNDERTPLIGTRIADFELVRQIGRGGDGIVFEAVDLRLGRTVALKLVLARGDGDEKERFERGARAMAGLPHPGLAEIYSAGESGPWRFIVMALVRGPTLAHALRSTAARERVGVKEWSDYVLYLGEQLAETLAFIHRHDWTHGDVKPSNIVLRAETDSEIDFTTGPMPIRPVLVDFGVAKLAPQTLETTTNSPITLAYASPEMILLGCRSRRADLFMLGATLHDLLTGTRPEARERAAGGVSRLDESVAGREVADVIARATHFAAADRYETADEFAADLRRVRLRVGVPSAKKESVRSTDRRIFAEAAGFLCLVGCGVLISFFARPQATRAMTHREIPDFHRSDLAQTSVHTERSDLPKLWPHEYLEIESLSSDKFFAPSLALGSDILVVGLPRFDLHQDAPDCDAGRVLLYRAGKDGFEFWQELLLDEQGCTCGTNEWSTSSFGHRVEVSPEGDVIAVACYHPHQSSTGRQVGIFHRTGDHWNLDRVLRPPVESKPQDQFAEEIALGDGFLAVGARGFNGERGRVYVYERRDDWRLSAKLSGGTLPSWFGEHVSAWRDWIVVGASRDPAYGPTAGAVHLFKRSSDGWTESATSVVFPPREVGAYESYFGFECGLSEAGLVVGACFYGDQRMGSAFFFPSIREGVSSVWSELLEQPRTEFAEFGTRVASYGNLAVVASHGKANRGSVELFHLGSPGRSAPIGEPVSMFPRPRELFGLAVAIDQNRIAVAEGYADVTRVYLYSVAN